MKGGPRLERLVQRLSSFLPAWATRSVTVGVASTIIDLLVGWACLSLGAPTRVASMSGVTVSATFGFFANRAFAFAGEGHGIGGPALRYALVTGAAMVVHGQLVVMGRDWWDVPYVFAKLGADVAVFSVGQPLWLRYIVFRRRPSVETPQTR